MTTPHYELVIGNKAWSSWSLRPWLAMKRLGLSFDEISIRLRRPESRGDILAHSPAGKVPVLKVDGFLVWDTLAILEYLAERHPLWPQEDRARAVARSVSAEMHSGFQALRDHCSMDLFARAPQSEFPPAVEIDIRRIVALWRDCRTRFGTGGPFLFGTFCAADAMYAPVASRFRTYVSDLAGFGDDGTAAAYVDTIFAMPEMEVWSEGARKELAG